MITVEDIAKKVNKSMMTVSRVVNNKPGVSNRTRHKVWDVIEEMGYVPNQEGIQLASRKKQVPRKTGNIGSITFSGYNKYSEPFFAEILNNIDKISIKMGLHHYLSYMMDDLDDKSLFLKKINNNCVDGCLLLAIDSQHKAQVKKIKEKVKHVVLIEDDYNEDDLSCVFADHLKAGYLATNYLAKLGHRKIACVVGFFNRAEFHQRKYEGYRKALLENNIEYDESLVKEGYYSIEGAIAAARALLEQKQHPTAIFVASDYMAVGVYKAIHQYGLKIPDDISIVGCDNSSVVSMLHPDITTINVDKYELARIAMQTLADKIDGKMKKDIKIVLPVELIKRHSCREI
jgi:LacI family transcriptional regulator